MDEINKRIIGFMVKSGHSKSTFARELGVSLPLITHITTGRNKPGLELLQRMLLTFPELDPDWLLNGKGQMNRQAQKQIDLSEELAMLSHIKDQIIKSLEQMPTISAYHKLLMDELLHLQELNLMIGHIQTDLSRTGDQLEGMKNRIKVKLEN